jgi:hypothetical protein
MISLVVELADAGGAGDRLRALIAAHRSGTLRSFLSRAFFCLLDVGLLRSRLGSVSAVARRWLRGAFDTFALAPSADRVSLFSFVRRAAFALAGDDIDAGGAQDGVGGFHQRLFLAQLTFPRLLSRARIPYFSVLSLLQGRKKEVFNEASQIQQASEARTMPSTSTCELKVTSHPGMGRSPWRTSNAWAVRDCSEAALQPYAKVHSRDVVCVTMAAFLTDVALDNAACVLGSLPTPPAPCP